MANGPDNALVEDVARSLVAEVAPEELLMFSAYSEQFFRDPAPLFRRQRASDDMLGFGAAEALVMATPFALTAAKAIVGFVWGVMKKPIEDQGSAVFSTWLRGVFGGAPAVKAPARLAPEQLAEVQRVVLEVAKKTEYPLTDAVLFSERVVARLAVASAAS